MPKITSVFAKLSKVRVPAEITQQDYKVIGKFFIVLYSTASNTDDINSARWMLFTRGGQSIENISPTGEALKQKQRRKQACGMAVWRNNALTIIQLIGAGKNLMKNILFWSDLPGAKTSYRELIKCSCKKSCKGRSNCGQLELQTTELLCAYAGQCWVTPKQTYLSLTETFSKWVSKD